MFGKLVLQTILSFIDVHQGNFCQLYPCIFITKTFMY